ncbi:unnamed protein product [Menidia menidia]|uniref:(Atlantic silverside) hypothetical protein n=1 Tax=Menidia menidia TaxID=238744 RepID=A0A8S4C124_9TELE|nr:unnamed protein product [Menidia menidia]
MLNYEGIPSKGDSMSSYQSNYWTCTLPKSLPPSPDRHSLDWNPNKEYQALLDYTYPLRPEYVEKMCTPKKQTEEEILKVQIASRLTFRVSKPPQMVDSPEPQSPLLITGIRPQSEYVCGELDEDFRPLPQKFEVMQQLFRQVKEITVKLSQPGKTSTRSLDSNTTPFLSTINLLRIQGVEEEDTDEIKEPCIDKQDASVGNKEEQKSAGQIGACGISATQRTSFATGLEPSEGGPSQSSVREVENLMQKLCGHTLSDSQSNNRRDQSNSCTLMQNIQIFCSHLELLIQQLYAVSQKIEQLATPTVDIESLKSSLAEYQSFHREVSRHQSVTSCVLHTGYQLLSSINSISPFLRDTLLLIERQSDIRQSSTDHFLSSIMSAMDTLTQTTTPSPVE